MRAAWIVMGCLAWLLAGCQSLPSGEQSAAGRCVTNAKSYAFDFVGETKGYEVYQKGKMPRMLDAEHAMVGACAMTAIAIERLVELGRPATAADFRRMQREVITRTIDWQLARHNYGKASVMVPDLISHTAPFLPSSLEEARNELPEWRKVVAYVASNPGTYNAGSVIMQEAKRIAGNLP